MLGEFALLKSNADASMYPERVVLLLPTDDSQQEEWTESGFVDFERKISGSSLIITLSHVALERFRAEGDLQSELADLAEAVSIHARRLDPTLRPDEYVQVNAEDGTQLHLTSSNIG